MPDLLRRYPQTNAKGGYPCLKETVLQVSLRPVHFSPKLWRHGHASLQLITGKVPAVQKSSVGVAPWNLREGAVVAS